VNPLPISMTLPTSSLPLGATSTVAAAKVAFSLDDRDLLHVLRRQAMTRLDLIETYPDNAAVVVADHPMPHATMPVLIVGSDQRPEAGGNAIRSLDPGLILSAAALVAAGHRIEPVARSEGDAASRLSARERQVAELLVEGATNKVIARRLGISVHTAKFHVAAVLDKLGARNRADAVAIALREGLIGV
jgi:DNA-binding NarL/FixJ family response regulator